MKRIINHDNIIGKKTAKDLDARRTKSTNWLNPISMSRLQIAVRSDAEDVVLEGIRYNITYGYKHTYPASGETVESIKLQRADGEFVPFAYISLKRIEKFDFAKGE